MGDSGRPSADELNALADRVEKLKRPDRIMDGRIATSVGWKPITKYEWQAPDGREVNVANIPKFTASIDAAMTLVQQSHESLTACFDDVLAKMVWDTDVCFTDIPRLIVVSALRAKASRQDLPE